MFEQRFPSLEKEQRLVIREIFFSVKLTLLLSSIAAKVKGGSEGIFPL